ncbi:hypothetical protein [Algoriphagus sp.]|uniref:hypothetical protein n=1 Tax=Algoriphagus sp. TaxID=1872435 RepID=UPI00262ABD2C|nr:hypothetical protein [Algoriphagus sp.]
MFYQIPIQEISTFAIWIPLILAGTKWRTSDRKIRLFFVFLLFGAITDIVGWWIYGVLEDLELGKYHAYLLNLYLWFEALFFIWLVFEFLQISQKSLWRRVLWTGISFLFLMEMIIRFGFGIPLDIYTSFLISGMMVLNSFLMAFALLGLAEKNGEIMRDPWFWILSGIFFYSFSVFFIDMLTYTSLGPELWKFRTLLNLIQYVFFVVGLIKINIPKHWDNV